MAAAAARETGSAAAKPRGGSTSPLEEHAAVILALVQAFLFAFNGSDAVL
jgi:hypothetical protein